MNKNSVFHFLIILVAVTTLFGCSQPAEERDLVVYSAGPRSVIEDIVADYEQKNGQSVRLFVATTGQLMAKLEAERFRPQADVVIFASPVAAEALHQQRRLMPLAPDQIYSDYFHNDWHHREAFYVATSAAYVGVGLSNTVIEALNASALAWNDLFALADKQRIAMPSPSRSGTAGDFVVDYVLRFSDGFGTIQQARRSGMEFPTANSQALSGLMVGTYDMVLGAVDYLVFAQQARGSDMKMFYPPEGVTLITRPAAILASTEQPEQAQQFVAHLLTSDSQERLASAHLLPLDRRVSLSPERTAVNPAYVWLPDAEEALRSQNDILRRFQYQVERAPVVRNP